jgi:phage FluMu protein Com
VTLVTEPRPPVHLHTLRCEQCRRILFEHERALEVVAEALGVLRLKCPSCNALNVLPRSGR